jgi:RNA polymerase sigma-70 factor (ECF subfamily)
MLAGAIDKKIIRRSPEETPGYGLMTDLQQDIELVQRIAAHDEAALRELYAAYGQRLYVYALRLTGEHPQAEDVVQDALMAVWRSARNFRADGRLLAWLLGIVHHIAIKTLRHHSIPISDEMEASLPATGPLPEEHIQIGEQVRRVEQGLQSLSPEHRAVLELVFYQGLSLKEAAEVCSCPVGTIKSRLSYARQQLRGILIRTEETR